MRKILDNLYNLCGYIAAIAIVLICLIVSAQVLLNLIAKVFGSAYSFTIPSYADFAGYLLAMASFLALAYTLNQGGHIRVTLVLQVLKPRVRFVTEIISLLLGTIISAYASFYMILLNIESHEFGDLSPGIIAIPIWIPQIFVTFGLMILTIAFIDLLFRTLTAGKPVLVNTGAE